MVQLLSNPHSWKCWLESLPAHIPLPAFLNVHIPSYNYFPCINVLLGGVTMTSACCDEYNEFIPFSNVYFTFSIPALLCGISYLWQYQQLPLEWESIWSPIFKSNHLSGSSESFIQQGVPLLKPGDRLSSKCPKTAKQIGTAPHWKMSLWLQNAFQWCNKPSGACSH